MSTDDLLNSNDLLRSILKKYFRRRVLKVCNLKKLIEDINYKYIGVMLNRSGCQFKDMLCVRTVGYMKFFYNSGMLELGKLKRINSMGGGEYRERLVDLMETTEEELTKTILDTYGTFLCKKMYRKETSVNHDS